MKERNKELMKEKSRQYYHDHKEERQRYNNSYWALHGDKYKEKRKKIDNTRIIKAWRMLCYASTDHHAVQLLCIVCKWKLTKCSLCA